MRARRATRGLSPRQSRDGPARSGLARPMADQATAMPATKKTPTAQMSKNARRQDAETKDTASKEESEDDYFIGDDAGEDNEDGEPAAEDSKKRKERLLSEKDIEAARLAEKRSGVIYMSRVPPFMKPAKVRHLLSKYGEIGRIYLARGGREAADAADQKRRQPQAPVRRRVD
ncbi:hypothetical protein DL89DRAFT_6019 [Linderina pennispora]|uniref:RRM domain-containing protein n=1 Tax=Linderina pennispora TaxID=61395 RepID=A0A1Y1WKP4_9FUNG|nr:uncharacterized protein DL89DRAFT_6019 [Linderina pennispora]ORX73888.1 hypothetical protein DL89DRAFT_6019 [Linderina pennispora]